MHTRQRYFFVIPKLLTIPAPKEICRVWPNVFCCSSLDTNEVKFFDLEINNKPEVPVSNLCGNVAYAIIFSGKSLWTVLSMVAWNIESAFSQPLSTVAWEGTPPGLFRIVKPNSLSYGTNMTTNLCIRQIVTSFWIIRASHTNNQVRLTGSPHGQ